MIFSVNEYTALGGKLTENQVCTTDIALCSFRGQHEKFRPLKTPLGHTHCSKMSGAYFKRDIRCTQRIDN